MPSLSELQQTAKTELNATLTQGLDDLSRFQVVTFTKYIRKVLPLDGFVFWVKASVLSSAPDSEPDTVNVKGYLHLTTESIQDDEQLYDRNVVTFTAQADIDPFNDIGSDVLYIGEFFGIQFSFSRRTGLNEAANLYHYSGEAIFPYMRSQIINSADDIDLADVVVSNSLPIWLSLSQFMPMYPAMLSVQNLVPPYATVKCGEPSPVAGAFCLDEKQNQYQLVSEDVTITVTGLRNAAVEDFLRYVQDYTLSDKAEMGVMNIPVIQDERITQNELNIIAMRKKVKFKVNYYQQRMRNVARRLITSAIPSIYVEK
ncbi:hypothetical protein GRG20_001490 [Salmonella enterica]|uniref:Uncharacterized protein n=1 Tax=Salmonella enterica TaxID=28901 RepID=A0A744FYR1_SALER|nr:hypothetical protein [Salmonella enterica]EBV8122694.1 hypothetical protein [Salmonella enterica subsp. enterica serovar Bareilly]EDV1003690.1 hypothetical protein [Salmonella enterica subsp. enterica]EDW4993123.1 hypothetical protein [Salmonella enterica subsp. enterica serovar Sandiego]EEE3049658.1 hypothetical protein [Salmonella enterica subsp. enterica serovar Duisburg]HAE9346365.1 hypothetical protein [Salmonella enterica subsp. enterica serovar Panama]HBJ6377141.1 hypothetical prote